ncbi:hypothetical protein E4T50_11147 [Aureobasidium sp. EXF-12298]|nr:hypothetical protein E4T50_11147 [Aureobasidium sp. EXF-12298]
MPHVLFRKQHVAVREIDLSKINTITNDPRHRPKKRLKYTPVPDEEFLELFTNAFNNHPLASSMMLELNCDRVQFVGGLPQGYACFAAPAKVGRSPDRYIFGHGHSKKNGYEANKQFRSFKEFVPHAYWIIVDQVVDGNRPRGCKCKYCSLPFPK